MPTNPRPIYGISPEIQKRVELFNDNYSAFLHSFENNTEITENTYINFLRGQKARGVIRDFTLTIKSNVNAIRTEIEIEDVNDHSVTLRYTLTREG